VCRDEIYISSWTTGLKQGNTVRVIAMQTSEGSSGGPLRNSLRIDHHKGTHIKLLLLYNILQELQLFFWEGGIY
jgi:hypothetical protein